MLRLGNAGSPACLQQPYLASPFNSVVLTPTKPTPKFNPMGEGARKEEKEEVEETQGRGMRRGGSGLSP